MWAHLTKFYAGGPDLAAAWGFIGAAQPLAQVLPSAHLPRNVVSRDFQITNVGPSLCASSCREVWLHTLSSDFRICCLIGRCS